MKNPIDAVAHIKHAGQYGCTHPGMAGRIRSRVMVRNQLAALLFMFGLLSCGGTERKTHSSQQPGMCAKEPMAADGIVRLSKVEVYPQYLDEYTKYATEVGEISLRTEPGVLTMYAVAEKENPCRITILETYNRPDTAQHCQPNQQLYKIIYSTHEKDTVFIICSNND